MSTIIEASIPFGPFKVTKNGIELENLVGYNFEVSVNNLPLITLRYGDTFKEKDEIIEARKTMMQITGKTQDIRIEVNSTSSEDVKVFIDEEKINYSQSLKLETDIYGENKLEISYVLGL